MVSTLLSHAPALTRCFADPSLICSRNIRKCRQLKSNLQSILLHSIYLRSYRCYEDLLKLRNNGLGIFLRRSLSSQVTSDGLALGNCLRHNCETPLSTARESTHSQGSLFNLLGVLIQVHMPTRKVSRDRFVIRARAYLNIIMDDSSSAVGLARPLP